MQAYSGSQANPSSSSWLPTASKVPLSLRPIFERAEDKGTYCGLVQVPAATVEVSSQNSNAAVDKQSLILGDENAPC